MKTTNIIGFACLFSMLVLSLGLIVPGRLVQKIKCKSTIKSYLRCFDDKTFPEEGSKDSETGTSHIFEEEVSDFGISTALADQHIILGNYEEAKQLAEKAIKIGTRTREVNNIYAAYAQGILGDALYHESDFKRAADLYRDALKTYERHFQSEIGPETLELVGGLQLIAWTLLTRKEYDDAKMACATALGMTERLHGPNSTAVASSMVNLATAQIGTGDVGSGPEALLKRALKSFEGFKKTDKENVHPETLHKIGVCHFTLGNLYNLRGSESDAEEQYERVAQMVESGEYKAPEAAAALKNLATIRWRHGKYSSAEKLLKHSLDILESSAMFGVDHEQTRLVRDMYGKVKEGFTPPPIINPSLAKQRTHRLLKSKNTPAESQTKIYLYKERDD